MRVLLVSPSTRKILSISGCVLVFLGLLFPAYFSVLFPGSATFYLSTFLLKCMSLLALEPLVALSALVILGLAPDRLPNERVGLIAAGLLICFLCSCVALPLAPLFLPLVIIGVPALGIIGVAHRLPARACAWLAPGFALLGLAALWFPLPLPWPSYAELTPNPSGTIFDAVGVAGALCLLGFLLALGSSLLALRRKAESAREAPGYHQVQAIEQ